MGVMRYAVVLISMLLVSCHSAPGNGDRFQRAQDLVDGIVLKNPDLVRLTIHAVPTGENASRIIACNVPAKLGQMSDPEDLEAMQTGTTVVLVEGNHLDVTAPILDTSGRAIAATGITLANPGGASEQELRVKAEAIAR
jgi:hypothetical protein